MKHSRTCPKCNSRKLWIIETFRHESENLGGRPLVVALRLTGKFMRGEERIGVFDAWVCAKCGFTELWARDFGELRHDAANGIRLVEAPEGEPYR